MELGIIESYISSVLKGEKRYLPSAAMDRACKVAVLIPIYDEDFDTILRALSSLALQKKVEPEEFEVVIIINNSREQAANNTSAYQANQEAIKFIRFIQTGQNSPAELEERHLEVVKSIQGNNLKTHLIDKSSLSSAYEENNVGIARNRAGAEICRRFLENGRGERGVIATLDCDTRVSDNYVKEIICSFEEYDLNGVAGNFIHETDLVVPNGELIRAAYELEVRMGMNLPVSGKLKSWYFKKRDNLPFQILVSGPNTAVSVKAWAQVGGVPKYYIWEDTIFGQMVEDLPGEVAYNTAYTVYPLARPSHRVTGLHSTGKNIEQVRQFVHDFLEGRSDRIYVRDRKKLFALIYAILEMQRSGRLSGEGLNTLMFKHDCRPHPYSVKELEELAQLILKDLAIPLSERTFKRTNQVVTEKIYPYCPVLDVTEKLRHLIEAAE